jgi:hypothetical protein
LSRDRRSATRRGPIAIAALALAGGIGVVPFAAFDTGTAAAFQPSAQAANGCKSPAPPRSLELTATGMFVTATWRRSPGVVSGYVIEVGRAPGASDVSVVDTGSAATSFSGTVPEGTFFIRVRARSACGAGLPSHETRITTGPYQIRPDIVVARRTPDRNTYFPSIARLPDRQLVVAYYDSPGHVSPTGRIALVRSADDGRTWTAPDVAFDTALDDRDPNLTVTRSGSVLLSYFAGGSGVDGQPPGVFVARSDDGARTWSAPVRVATTLVGAATSAPILELANRDLLIPLYGATDGSNHSRAVVMRSGDGGLTWPPDREASIPVLPGIDFEEPAIVEIDGRLLAILRTEEPDHLAYQASSGDGGRTWSTPTRLDVAAQASDLIRLSGRRDVTTAAVHAWADWSRRYGDSRPTVVQSIRWPAAAVTPTFGAPRLVYNGHCDDAGYPSGVVIDDRRLFVVFYDACLGYVGGAYVDIDSLK